MELNVLICKELKVKFLHKKFHLLTLKIEHRKQN